MTPRLRQAQGAQGGDDDLNGEDHPFVHRATTAAAAPTGANEPTTGNTTGIGPMGGEAGGQTRLDLQEEFAEDTAFLGYGNVNETARHLYPNETQDAGWHTIAALMNWQLCHTLVHQRNMMSWSMARQSSSLGKF